MAEQYQLTLQAMPGDVPAVVRLRRLCGIRAASDLIDAPNSHRELLTYRPGSWELP